MMATYQFVNGQLANNGKPVIVNASGGLPDLPPLSGLGLFDRLLPGNIPSPEDLVGSIPDAANTVTDTTSATVTAGKSVAAAARWMSDRDNWFRIAKVLLGGVMIIEGLAMLTSHPGIVATAAKAVK